MFRKEWCHNKVEGDNIIKYQFFFSSMLSHIGHHLILCLVRFFMVVLGLSPIPSINQGCDAFCGFFLDACLGFASLFFTCLSLALTFQPFICLIDVMAFLTSFE
jgi:hypothetical protein